MTEFHVRYYLDPHTGDPHNLRVVYVPEPETDSVFVITAFELTGKPLAAFRRRQKKKR